MPSRPYSYLHKLTMDLYAYSYYFSNRLIAAIKIPGIPNLTDSMDADPIACPYGCQHGKYRGGLHAVTCNHTAAHMRGHTLVEDVVLLMIKDALAIDIANGKSTAVMADEKRPNAQYNLASTIPVTPITQRTKH